ncbi:arylamine N-acetyltransferase, pineal gland isozyme NAT-10 [Pogona vitticeps]
MNIAEYFARTGYKGSLDTLDLETLTAVFQHHICAVPFENLSIHCGETITLDLEDIYTKIVKKRRGGWCMENNLLLSWVLKTMGYDTTILGAYVYFPQQKAYDTIMSHLILQVVIDGKSYIVDAGFGVSYQMWQPMELVSGKDQPQIPGVFRFTEENGIWYFEKIRRKQHIPTETSSSLDLIEKKERRNVYLFSIEPRMVEDFRSPCSYLQTSPDSLCTKKSICSLQTINGFRALVGWTLSEMTYRYKEDVDLVEFTTLKNDEVEKTLEEKFGITLENKLVPVNLPEFFTI